MQLGALKALTHRLGIYRTARLIHRNISPRRRAQYRAEISFYSNFISSNDLCFDIGANIGSKTEAFLAIGASVVAVEPQPDLAREIRARTKEDVAQWSNALLANESQK